jgi:hypothetical protein
MVYHLLFTPLFYHALPHDLLLTTHLRVVVGFYFSSASYFLSSSSSSSSYDNKNWIKSL